MTEPKIVRGKLTDAVPDPVNANQHTERGMHIVTKSVRERGIFRPIAAAGKGVDKPVIKAGNLTQEVMLDAGMGEDAIFIYTDGKTPIIHVRTDIEPDSPEAALLAIEDNRSAEVSNRWNPEMLAVLNERIGEAGGSTRHLFSDDELRVIFDAGGLKASDDIDFSEFGEAQAHEIKYRVVIDGLDLEGAQAMVQDLAEAGARLEQYRA